MISKDEKRRRAAELAKDSAVCNSYGMPYKITGFYGDTLPPDDKNEYIVFAEKTNRERRKAIIRELEARRRARIIDEADEWARREER